MIGKALKTTIILAFVGAIMGAGIVVAVKMPGQIKARQEAALRMEKQRRQGMIIDIADLKIPQEFRELLRDSRYPYRPRMEKWTEEQAARFWVDPGEIGIDVLEKTNDERIEEILRNVP